MDTLLAKLLVLINATLLALPPGWCCGPGWGQEAAAPTKPACCNAEDGGSGDHDAPPNPEPDCGCQADSAPTTAAPRVALDMGPALTSAVDSLDVEPSLTFTTPVRIAEPPFRILHCVWRC